MRLISALLLCTTFIACGGSSSPTPRAPGTSGAPDVPAIQDPVKKIWTCADKTRILLRAEDGTVHCLKF